MHPIKSKRIQPICTPVSQQSMPQSCPLVYQICLMFFPPLAPSLDFSYVMCNKRQSIFTISLPHSIIFFSLPLKLEESSVLWPGLLGSNSGERTNSQTKHNNSCLKSSAIDSSSPQGQALRIPRRQDGKPRHPQPSRVTPQVRVSIKLLILNFQF